MKYTHVVTDTDGCLTDNRITFYEDGVKVRVYNAYDYEGFKQLKELGANVYIVSGANSGSTSSMAAEVKTPFSHAPDKLRWALENLGEEIVTNSLVFMGNDTIDLSLLERCALPVAPKNAHRKVLALVKERGGLITDPKGGDGAFRWLSDYLIDHELI